MKAYLRRRLSHAFAAFALFACLAPTTGCYAQFGGGLPSIGGGKKGGESVDAAAMAKQFGFNVPMRGGDLAKLLALVDFETKSTDALLASLRESVAAALKAQGVTMEMKSVEDLAKGVDKLSASSKDDLKKLGEEEKKSRDAALAKLFPALLVGGKMVAAVPPTVDAAKGFKPSLADGADAAKLPEAAKGLGKAAENLTAIAPLLPKLTATLDNAGIQKPDSKEITKQANKMLKESGAGGEISAG
jgi:hypothetical protein